MNFLEYECWALANFFKINNNQIKNSLRMKLIRQYTTILIVASALKCMCVKFMLIARYLPEVLEFLTLLASYFFRIHERDPLVPLYHYQLEFL